MIRELDDVVHGPSQRLSAVLLFSRGRVGAGVGDSMVVAGLLVLIIQLANNAGNVALLLADKASTRLFLIRPSPS